MLAGFLEAVNFIKCPSHVFVSLSNGDVCAVLRRTR